MRPDAADDTRVQLALPGLVVGDRLQGRPLGHAERRGDRVRFRAPTGLVERVEDARHRTVYSRRPDSDEFAYCHLWFGHEPVADGTELRCVADFEMAPSAAVGDAEMEAVVRQALRANLAATARLAELDPTSPTRAIR